MCGARNLGEALRRIGEGAAMIRTKGEAGSGNIVEAVRHIRAITSEIRQLTTLREEELMAKSKELGSPYDLVKWVSQNGKLPVPNFSAGGIATPADASLVMQLGAEAVFVGSGIFKSSDPAQRAKAIVRATTHYNEPLSRGGVLRRSRRGHERPGHSEDGPQGVVADAGVVGKQFTADSPQLTAYGVINRMYLFIWAKSRRITKPAGA